MVMSSIDYQDADNGTFPELGAYRSSSSIPTLHSSRLNFPIFVPDFQRKSGNSAPSRIAEHLATVLEHTNFPKYASYTPFSISWQVVRMFVNIQKLISRLWKIFIAKERFILVNFGKIRKKAARHYGLSQPLSDHTTWTGPMSKVAVRWARAAFLG